MTYDEWMKKESMRKQSVYITDKVYGLVHVIRESKRERSQKTLSFSELLNAAVELAGSKLEQYVERRYQGEEKERAIREVLSGGVL